MIESPISEEPRGESLEPALVALIDQTEAELAEIRGLANASDARTVELMAALLRSGGWNQSGISSPAHYLMWKCGVSRGDANRIVRVARRIGTWARCASAFAAGELSLEQANIICSCSPPGWADESTLHFATVMTVTQLRHVLANYAFTEPGSPEAVAEEEAAEQAAPERRRVSFGPTRDGRWRLHAELPADEGAAVETALQACRDDLFHQRHGEPPGHGAGGDDANITWADALAEMAERALTTGATLRPHHDRYRILWHHSIDPDGHPILRAHQSGQVDEWMRRFLTCDTTVTPVAHTRPSAADSAADALAGKPERDINGLLAVLANGAPVNVGRSQRIVPDRVRRLIEHRDGTCRIPGCDTKHWLVVHHIIHWENGGPTDTHNLVAICPRHHRQIHQDLLHLTGNADVPGALTITDDTGRTLTGAARAAPPDAPPQQAAHQLGLQPGTWQHPLGERLQHNNVHFNRSG